MTTMRFVLLAVLLATRALAQPREPDTPTPTPTPPSECDLNHDVIGTEVSKRYWDEIPFPSGVVHGGVVPNIFRIPVARLNYERKPFLWVTRRGQWYRMSDSEKRHCDNLPDCGYWASDVPQEREAVPGQWCTFDTEARVVARVPDGRFLLEVKTPAGWGADGRDRYDSDGTCPIGSLFLVEPDVLWPGIVKARKYQAANATATARAEATARAIEHDKRLAYDALAGPTRTPTRLVPVDAVR